MKVISIETGRVGVVIPLTEVFPLFGAYLPDVASKIVERYAFAFFPTLSGSFTELRERGLEFQIGKLRIGDKAHHIIGFTVLKDVLIANAYSTEVARLFVEDLFAWGTENLGFRAPLAESRSYLFFSEIVVEFDGSISGIIRGFETLSKSITRRFRSTYKLESHFDVESLVFDRDKTISGDPYLNLLAPFTIQRQSGKPFDSNRFFCKAPLPTEDHIKLLEEIEISLKAR